MTAFLACHMAYADDTACHESTNCINANSWQLAVALGAGIRLNPLQDGDNIPLVVIPDVAYYGENWYWDNTEAGYQWQQTEKWSVETFLRINAEKSLFSFWHSENILTNTLDTVAAVAEGDQEAIVGDSPVDDPDAPPSFKNVSIDLIADRDWALDAGIRFHYLHGNSAWSLTLLTDASDLHHGHQVNLSHNRFYQWGGWQIQPTFSLQWKSSQLTDYYYGLGPRDNLPTALFYKGKSGWQPALRVVLTKPINAQWNWLIMSSYQHLHKGMRRSPIVRKNSVITAFAGVSYRF